MFHVSIRNLMRHIIILPMILSYQAVAASSTSLTLDQFNQEFGHLQNLKTLSADFKQTRSVKSWGTEVKTSGRFSVFGDHNKQVLWEITDPTYTAMKMQPEGLFVKVSEQKEAPWKPLKNSKMEKQMKSVFSWLRFDGTTLLQEFNVQKINDREYQLTPKKKGFPFSQIAISLHAKKHVREILMQEPNADSIRIEFSNTQIKK